MKNPSRKNIAPYMDTATGASFRLLILDDSADDARLSEQELRLSGLAFESCVAADRQGFLAALEDFYPEVILAETRIPGFGGMDAFHLARERDFEGAFLWVSASLSDAEMTEALRQGVTNCVIKRHVDRLGLAVRRALSEHRINLSYRQSEERYWLLVENLPVVTYRATVTPERQLFWVSHQSGGILGWTPWLEAGSSLPRLADFIVHEDQDWVLAKMRAALAEHRDFDEEYRILSMDGQVRWVHDRATAFRGRSESDSYLIGVMEDVTERRLDQNRLARLSALYHAMSQSSQSMVRATQCTELYEGMCRALVDAGAYLGAWIVYGKDQRLQVMAAAGVGDEIDLLSDPHEEVTLCDDCPVRALLRGESFSFRRDLHLCDHWHSRIQTYGCHSMAIIPFAGPEAGDIGAVAVVSERHEPLDGEEIELLQRMAEELAFGMTRMREQLERNLLLKRLELQNLELAAARDAANESALAKMRFLAAMSHEIRTPLNGIIGMTQLLLGTPMSPAQRDDFNSIRRASNHLLGVVSEVLDFSRLESGRVTLEKTVFSPAETVRQIAASLSPAVHGKPQLAMTVEIAEDVPPLVLGDAYRFHVVLYNLVGNAIKFTEQGGICLRLQRRSDAGPLYRLEVRVTDTGPGIPPVDQERVFDPFEQVEGGRTRSHGGTGLGLPISRHLARLMGGDIRVESALGMGSTFVADLNFAPPPVGAVAEATVEVQAVISLPPGLRVLVAEDDPINQKVTSRYLAKLGVQVKIAQNGMEAVKMQSEQGFDVILMDLHMPGMDGIDAAHAIRHLDGVAAKVPIIAFTADVLAETEVIQDGLMQGYLLKPVTVFNISQAIRSALNLSLSIS